MADTSALIRYPRDIDGFFTAMVHSRDLLYSPYLPTMRFDCDPDVTRRFVP